MKRLLLFATVAVLVSSPLRSQLIPITARELVPEATTTARADLAGDAYLLNIVFASISYSGYQISMDLSSGKATAWVYRYYSPSLDSTEFYIGVNIIFVGHQIVKLPNSVALPAIPIESKRELTDPCLDSPAALQAVKDAGADAFLQAHTDATVEFVIAGDNPVETPVIPAGKLWFFTFRAPGAAYACAVDAATGAGIRCGVVSGAPVLPVAPGSVQVAMFPNPLSPASAGAARVQVTLASRESVRLSLVDMLGRERAVLADGVLEPGSSFFRIPAELTERSGSYLLRARTASAVRTLRVIVLR